MAKVTPEMKMPELMVLFRTLAVGFLAAEVWRVASYLGKNFSPEFINVNFWVQLSVILIIITLCCYYVLNRGAISDAARIIRSCRIDLLLAVVVGVWVNSLLAPNLKKIHDIIQNIDPYWTPAILAILCIMLISPIFQNLRARLRKDMPQLYFLSDDEIKQGKEDALDCGFQAESFARTVLASNAHPGLVFGIDGPWGVGKTSFINLAARHWEKHPKEIIVCRFEPLRFASEPDLTDRLIKELSATIQREVYAPEFRPVANRYSRLIKGKADISFLGFKLAVEPSQETLDELLDDIDDVLRRIGKRVVIVIDDLDRLDAKTANSVLFASRRTFRLSQATFILCYDTEILAGIQEETSRAREFLEKFVTVKLSLFVDTSSIRNFLTRDWHNEEQRLTSVPSDTMVRLGEVLSEVAEIVGGDKAASYLPYVGDLRKVKRFVNALLILQMERSDLSRTDFNKVDLINLILLHLFYPGTFRLIYAEETEGRSGRFSLKINPDADNFMNSPAFSGYLDNAPAQAFLLRQLFDAKTLELPPRADIEQSVRVSRACFNHGNSRNLESYLKLIVRFVTPEPQDTFVMYQKAVEEVVKGKKIDIILSSENFDLAVHEQAHDQFWRLLVNSSSSFNHVAAEDAINTLVEYLPRYASIGRCDGSLRHRSIFSLLRLLDRAGWGRTNNKRLENSKENVIEIARRIFGTEEYKNMGLLGRLACVERGALGWNDLMLFRLQCSADRRGQLYNLQTALIVFDHPNAKTSGVVTGLAIMGMRRISQEVFAKFKTDYIDKEVNFYSAVDAIPVESFDTLGLLITHKDDPKIKNEVVSSIFASRLGVKNFVIYQLSNSKEANGSGVGCGYYDESGVEDNHGISILMDHYVFGFCFNPDVDENNVYHFLDYCLASLTNSYFEVVSDDGFVASKDSLIGHFDIERIALYWKEYGSFVRAKAEEVPGRKVVTSNYIATYAEDLDGVFKVLDEIVNEREPA
ncbi:KAP P-loop protein [Pseudomonas sp. FSL R10-1350]|uniref:KAP family NTPase n=1 Tax=Pseudomonas sp. FSL R10-1350 TaxID=2662197 RepID=UPI001296A669|nr:KAP family NTPase [Pseudomonas sp. FSL R10-1350]MQU62284.1 KAP P-loop protein [Pseudomonas sp. FSL R10-1350]